MRSQWGSWTSAETETWPHVRRESRSTVVDTGSRVTWVGKHWQKMESGQQCFVSGLRGAGLEKKGGAGRRGVGGRSWAWPESPARPLLPVITSHPSNCRRRGSFGFGDSMEEDGQRQEDLGSRLPVRLPKEELHLLPQVWGWCLPAFPRTPSVRVKSTCQARC